MDSLPTVILKPGETERVLAGHPWIYQGSILRLVQAIADGAVVQVKDYRFRFLGIGLYNSKSKIHVRMLSRERVNIDADFFAQRIGLARAHRQQYMPGASSFRLVNAESDLLSGLIVDQYEDVLVVQTSALGMDQRKPLIVEVLKKQISPRAIIERNDMASRKFEGLADAQAVLFGTVQSPIQIRLNDLQFQLDIGGGHKTGLYLDQQVNYQRVAELARGGRVLDCFCFAGGFALHAARNGAAQVHGLDQSLEAVALASQNARANGLDGRCSFEPVNVFDWLKAKTIKGPHEKLIPQFDLIILDPPSFTRNRAAVPDALRGYQEIHIRAMKLLKPGGILATFCCSHHVHAQMFQEVILEAAFDAHRLLRRIATYAQSPDHPIIPAIPETEYLKGFAFEMLA